MQNLRIAGVIDLPECLPTFCFQIVRFGIFYLNNDSGVRIIDLNHDITEAVSGFPVGADHPPVLKEGTWGQVLETADKENYLQMKVS